MVKAPAEILMKRSVHPDRSRTQRLQASAPPENPSDLQVFPPWSDPSQASSQLTLPSPQTQLRSRGGASRAFNSQPKATTPASASTNAHRSRAGAGAGRLGSVRRRFRSASAASGMAQVALAAAGITEAPRGTRPSV